MGYLPNRTINRSKALSFVPKIIIHAHRKKKPKKTVGDKTLE